MKEKNYSTREIMIDAHYLVKLNRICLRDALKKAWAIAKLRSEMRSDILMFYYYKKDGTCRKAYGTLNLNYIPEKQNILFNRKKNSNKVVYFDIEKNQFRSFVKENYIQ